MNYGDYIVLVLRDGHWVDSGKGAWIGEADAVRSAQRIRGDWMVVRVTATKGMRSW